MFAAFADLALGGKPDPFWSEIALKTQQVLDACLDSARAGGRIIEVDAAASRGGEASRKAGPVRPSPGRGAC